MKKKINITYIVILAFAVLFAFTFLNKDNFSFVFADQEEPIGSLTHETIVTTTERFMELIVQDVDENYRVTNFSTKEELLEAFTEVTTKEVASPYIDFYFTEKKNSLYLLPTETPPWFVPENDYNMIQLDNTKYKIVQTNDSNMYGEYTIELYFTLETDWKITEIVVK